MKTFETKNVEIIQPEGEFKVAIVGGRILPPLDYVQTTYELIPREDDVFVVTYPKSGTTWLQHICLQLLRDDYSLESKKVSDTQDSSSNENAKPVKSIPWYTCLEHFPGTLVPHSQLMSKEEGEALINSSPRLIKTHLKLEEIPYSPIGKYIYVARNPKDTLLSYYNHHKIFKGYNWKDGEFEVFFKMFLENRLPHGNQFDHLLNMLNYKDKPNVLVLKYEELLVDLPAEIKKIGEFIGGKAAEKVNNKEMLDQMVHASMAETMKGKQEIFFNTISYYDNKPVFMQNATSKKWKTKLSKEQSDKMDEMFEQKLKGTPLASWWENELKWDDK